MDRIGHTVYINLERRRDRRAEVEAELAALGLPAQRFEAIERSPGILGCGLSHLAVLEQAAAAEWPQVLILEDDFEPLVSGEEFAAAVGEALDAVGDDWDVLMLAYHLESSEPVAGQPNLLRVGAAQTASAYIVNRPFYRPLIELYRWAMPLLERTGRHWEFANDQIWKRVQPTTRWFATAKRLAKQRASYSDNARGFMNYGI
jgi:glycosyl transferase family 25